MPPVINQYLGLSGGDGLFTYESLLGLYTFSQLLMEGSVSREEAYAAAQAVSAVDPEISEPVVYILRKYGVPFCITAGEMQKIQFDGDAALAATVSVSQQKRALDTLLGEKGMIS